jgi:hypothetical protein
MDGAPPVPIAWKAGDDVEHDLALAHDALAGLDFDGAERNLARAEAILRDHPELPEAAWLLAEVERGWSSRWLRDGDETRAKQAWERAAAIDGGRAPGLTEKAFDPLPTIAATIVLDGAGSLRVDGRATAPGSVKLGAGKHTLSIVRADGAVTWAEWVSFAEGITVHVTAPPSPACSATDLGQARIRGGEARAAGARCGRWVAAVDEGDATIRVAACAGESCGPVGVWRDLALAGDEAKKAESRRGGWPAWATWTLAGIGVAGATVAIVAAAGAFKQAPTETQFVNGGLQVHALPWGTWK